MTYTSTDDIYFLNDKNIASGVDVECPAGFNAVPSQSAFVEKYGELSTASVSASLSVEAISSRLSSYEISVGNELKNLSDWLNLSVETSCRAISAKLSAVELSTETLINQTEFLSGRIDERLCLSGGTLSGQLSVQRGISAESLRLSNFEDEHGFSELDFGKDGLRVNLSGTAGNLDVSAATIKVQIENGLAGLSVNGESLSSTISVNLSSAKAYADGLKDQVVSADGQTSADSTVFGAKAYADGLKDQVVSADGATSADSTVFGAKAYADELKNRIVGSAEDLSTANTVFGSKAYADGKIEKLILEKTNCEASQTVKNVSETNGVVSMEFQDINLRQNQVENLNTSLSSTNLSSTNLSVLNFLQFQRDDDGNYTMFKSDRTGGIVLSTSRDSAVRFGSEKDLSNVVFGDTSLSDAISSARTNAETSAKNYVNAEIRKISCELQNISCSETLSTVEQKDGKITVTKQSIKIEQKQVDGLENRLTGIENYVSSNFLSVGGGTVNGKTTFNKIIVTSDLDVDGRANVREFRQFQQDSDGDDDYTVLSSGAAGFCLSANRPINIYRHGSNDNNFEGLRGIFVNDVNLCSTFENTAASAYNSAKTYVDGKVSAISTEIDVGDKKIITKLTQTNGVITVETNRIASADVDGLQGFVKNEIKLSVEDLSVNLTGDMREVHKELCGYVDKKIKTVYRPAGSVRSYAGLLDLSNGWSDELSDHIGEVRNVFFDETKNLSGTNYVFVSADSGELNTYKWDELGGIFDIGQFYTKEESDSNLCSLSITLEGVMDSKDDAKYDGLISEISSTSATILLSVENLSDRADPVINDYIRLSGQVSGIAGYADRLSAVSREPGQNKGIIQELSDDISALRLERAHDVSFNHHFRMKAEDLSSKSLTALFDQCSHDGAVPNGLLINVALTGENDVSAETKDDEDSFRKLKIGNGDWILIHGHTTEQKIPVDDLSVNSNSCENGQVYVIKAGVSKYDLVETENSLTEFKRELKETFDNYCDKLSGVLSGKTEDAVTPYDSAKCVSCVMEMLLALGEKLNS